MKKLEIGKLYVVGNRSNLSSVARWKAHRRLANTMEYGGKSGWAWGGGGGFCDQPPGETLVMLVAVINTGSAHQKKEFVVVLMNENLVPMGLNDLEELEP